MKVTKRTVLWIVPILLIGAFYYFYGPKDAITENAYIDYVKSQTLVDNSNLTVEQAFNNYCEVSDWVFFETQRGQKVVEFKGKCPVEEITQSVNLQFLVDDEQTEHTVGAMLLNDVKQSSEERDTFIQTIYKN
ncbi:glucosamine 6-phosphate synthetase [Lysinibacillus sp. KU-BSD001]|uniref:glucosamine 6-phosphate synthetase n=1 Tax=Lysinibacillus sp. KU-BSD001 TaxID=3141328 RepID=UPI0036E85A94